MGNSVAGFKLKPSITVSIVVRLKDTLRQLAWIELRRGEVYFGYMTVVKQFMERVSYHRSGRINIHHGGRVVHSQLDKPLDPLEGNIRLFRMAFGLNPGDLEECPPLRRSKHGHVIHIDPKEFGSSVSVEGFVLKPFDRGAIPLRDNAPVTLHILTHSNPWLAFAVLKQPADEK